MKYIILTALLTSCGATNSGGSNAPEIAPTAPQAATSNVPYTSYYVTDVSSLKDCAKDTLGVLAYVQSSSQFMACMATGWQQVNVNGKDGSNGKDAPTIGSNQWYDAITQKYWTMTNVLTSTTGRQDANTNCSGNYRMPSKAEVISALIHGMGTASGALTSPPAYVMPTLASVPSNGYVIRVSDATQQVATSAAEFCIQQ